MRTSGLAVILLALLTLPALAQSEAQTAQRERMKTCNADAGDKKLSGDARKTFMADCLAGKNAAEPEKTLTPQQAKMVPKQAPYAPTVHQLHRNGRLFPPNYLHDSWLDYLYWDTELDP